MGSLDFQNTYKIQISPHLKQYSFCSSVDVKLMSNDLVKAMP
jgi:hypothetical protein